MDLSVKNLLEAGAFVGRPVQQEIKWRQGDNEYVATVWVKPMSYETAIAGIRARQDDRDEIAERIAMSIVDQDGKPVFTAADITGDADPDRGPLDHDLTMALLAAIGEANNRGKTSG